MSIISWLEIAIFILLHSSKIYFQPLHGRVIWQFCGGGSLKCQLKPLKETMKPKLEFPGVGKGDQALMSFVGGINIFWNNDCYLQCTCSWSFFFNQIFNNCTFSQWSHPVMCSAHHACVWTIYYKDFNHTTVQRTLFNEKSVFSLFSVCLKSLFIHKL